MLTPEMLAAVVDFLDRLDDPELWLRQRHPPETENWLNFINDPDPPWRRITTPFTRWTP
jgi:hypothetical protein